MRTDTTRACCGLLANLAAIATASTVHAQTRVVYVDDDAPLGGDGTSWSNAFASLDDAIHSVHGIAAGSSVEVRIAEGVYTPVEQHQGWHRFEVSTITSGLTVSLFGGFAGVLGSRPDARDVSVYKTVLSADIGQNDHTTHDWSDNAWGLLAIQVEGGCTIDGVTFSGLRENGLFCIQIWMASSWTWDDVSNSQDVVLRNCTFTDNSFANWNEAALVSVWNNQRAAKFIMEDCVVEDFQGGGGNAKGIVVHEGHVEIRRSSLRSGPSGIPQPVLHVERGSLKVEDSDFLGHQMVYTEGTHTVTSAATLFDRCLFLFNKQHLAAAAPIHAENARLRDCILRNEGPIVSAVGGALLNVLPGAGFVSVERCSVQGGETAVAGALSKLRWLDGNITSSPMFVDIDGPDDNLFTWDDNDLSLSPSSPCIDAGRFLTPLRNAIDLVGSPRFFDGDSDGVVRLDMGPREYPARCPADFDGSGFVDTDDFDAFVQAFEAGC